ncbi:MAG: glycosyltransferase family 4 protein [Cytophagaceae bacterium]
MDLKHICIDGRMLNASGIGTYIKNLLAHLEGKFKITILGRGSELFTIINSRSVEVIEFNCNIYSLKEQLLFPFLIPPCDIFWSPHYNVPILPIRAKRRMVTIHDVFHLAFFDQLSMFQKLYSRFVLSQAANKSDSIITVSNFSKSEIGKYLNVKEDKIAVIHNGVDYKKFSCLSDSGKVEISKKYNLPARYLLFLGNVKPHKNLQTLINAFAYLKGQYSNVDDLHLVIVGKKKGFITGVNNIDDIINSKGLQHQVRFIESALDNELPYLFHLSQMLVFPSLYEGFGLPPLEAMAAGCPVIASHIPSVIEVCNDTALYFDPNDYICIAEKIHTLLENTSLRDELIEKGYQNVLKFSWKNSAMRHIELLQSLSA